MAKTETPTDQDLISRLPPLRWLGGSPCSGKSSVSEILADRYDLDLYHVDAQYQIHRHRLDPERHPMMTKWTQSPWGELWMQPLDVLLDEAIAAYAEHFSLILEDLTALPPTRMVLVEGTALLPGLVAPLLSDTRDALWMVPTGRFQRETYPKRGEWVNQVLATCEDPEAALKNWMDRDVAFARWVLSEVERLGLISLVVDGSNTIADNAEVVAAHFRLG